MTTEILRCPAPDDDLYVVWSHNVDDVIYFGSRTQVAEFSRDEAALHCRRCAAVETAERMGRVDRVGTSALWRKGQRPPDVLIVRGSGELRLADLASYVRGLT
jgi:hypothetical protein